MPSVLPISFFFLAKSYTHYASRYLNGYGSSQHLALFLGALGCIVLAWIVLINWERIVESLRVPEEEVDPLLLELCQAHKLSRSEIHFLKNQAVRLQATHPADLFVNPSMWTSLTNSSHSETIRLKKLYKVVFGSELLPESKATT